MSAFSNFLHHTLFSLLRGNRLSGAVGDHAVVDETLDQPMTFATAMISSIDTGLAQIVVTTITDVAVIVLVRDRLAAVIAVNAERSGGEIVEARQGGSTHGSGLAM